MPGPSTEAPAATARLTRERPDAGPRLNPPSAEAHPRKTRRGSGGGLRRLLAQETALDRPRRGALDDPRREGVREP
jgi:hypothetical protein